MLKRLKDGGLTTLVSTAYMDEATRCDRVALIQDGKIMLILTQRSGSSLLMKLRSYGEWMQNSPIKKLGLDMVLLKKQGQ